MHNSGDGSVDAGHAAGAAGQNYRTECFVRIREKGRTAKSTSPGSSPPWTRFPPREARCVRAYSGCPLGNPAMPPATLLVNGCTTIIGLLMLGMMASKDFQSALVKSVKSLNNHKVAAPKGCGAITL